MDTYGVLNDILVKLFNEIMDIEEKAIITPEFSDITNNDMHVIEAIGMGEKKNMSAIAGALGVTVGSLTIAMNGLVKKNYVKRERSEEDRRVVYIALTGRGEKAYVHHMNFHKEMIAGVVSQINEEEQKVLIKALSSLYSWFKERQEENKIQK